MPNIRNKLYTARQVRGLDHAAIHEFGVAGYELMCRAGRAVVDVARSNYPSSANWLVMCGPGNNGGDGYVVARLVAESGIKVTVCSLVDVKRLSGDAALAFEAWQEEGGEVLEWPPDREQSYDLALDALLGTGIRGDVEGNYATAIDYLNRLTCPRVAIDIPSGLNADTGCVLGRAIQAQCTVTFVGQKQGMYTASGPDFCGEISFDDLGIPLPSYASVHELLGLPGILLDRSFLAKAITPRLKNSHKGSFGHVLAVGGIEGMGGAIRLCGEAALRSGAGRVTLATSPVHAGMLNLSRPELMVKGITDDEDLAPELKHVTVLAVGPGLGRSSWSMSLMESCLNTDLPTVVDADGLNLLKEFWQPDSHSRDNWVLTPHPAEAARLLDCTVAEIQLDRVRAALKLAERYRASVVLKGCGTIIASPQGEYAICPLGNPGMATAGSGDVLTGIIAALMGQGLSCYTAARAGVIAHADAGDRAAEIQAEIAMLAGDITAQLPVVWKNAEAGNVRVGEQAV